MKEYFAFNNYDDALSRDNSIIRGDKYRITLLSDILVRLEYSPTGKFEDRPTELVINRKFDVPKFIKKEDENFLVITTSYFKLEYQKNKPFYGSKINPSQYLKISLNNTDKVWYFGAPEARNFKGTCYSLDDGKYSFDKGLYSTDGFVSIDDSKSLIFNKDGSLGKRSDERIDTYLFMYRKDFGFCLRDYFKLTGKPALIPRYSLGVWWNKNIVYNTKMIEDLVWSFKKNEIPLSIFLMSPDWHIVYEETNNTGFTFDYSLIKNPKEMIDYLHRNNIYIGLNIDPSGGIHPEELAYKRFINNAGIKEEGIIPFNVFDKNILSAYFDELLKPLSDVGVDFYWLDYHNSKDLYSLRALNHFHFSNFKVDNKRRGMLLSRNGLLAAHRYPILYSGQTEVTWDNLRMLPEFNSRAANIGVSWWSHDIGGYKNGIEDPELYMRFVQFGTFSPILRFSSDSSHYYKREPWLWDALTYSVVKDYLKLRHRLIPYLYTEAYKYSCTGLPLIQPLYYRYPELYDEPDYKNEYYFGSELFIAPITRKKDVLMSRAIIRIFLPNGIWYDFKTGKKFIGGKRYVSFYKDEDYPVFAKIGTIVPMSVLGDDLNNTNSPSKMEIQIFPGKSNVYKLYEDDGISRAHEDGYYLVTDIDYNYQLNNFTVIIRPTAGKSGVIPLKRDYIIRFRNTRMPEEVIIYIGEEKLDKVDSYVDGNDYVVVVSSVDTSKQLSINCKGKDIEIDAERIINEDVDSIISDLQINTALKENIAAILFSDLDIKKKRIEIRKLKVKGLSSKYIRMFIKLLEYIAEI